MRLWDLNKQFSGHFGPIVLQAHYLPQMEMIQFPYNVSGTAHKHMHHSLAATQIDKLQKQ